MTLKQLENLIEIDQDITDDNFGTYYDQRTIEQLLNYGIIILDKPPGPTSHETVAWTKTNSKTYQKLDIVELWILKFLEFFLWVWVKLPKH